MTLLTSLKQTLATTAVALMTGASFAQGAVLIEFDMSEHELANNETVVLTSTSTLAAGISSPSAQPNGTFGTGGSGTQDGEINWDAWGQDAEFLAIEFTVDAGQQFDLGNLTLDVSRNGGGAPEIFYAAVLPGTGLTGADIGLAPELDAQAVAIGNGSGGSVGLTQSWDLSSVATLSAGSYTIAFGQNDSGAGGNMRISKIVVNSAIPEPTSLCLFGLGLAGTVMMRRNRSC